jgi:hypothetical protein
MKVTTRFAVNVAIGLYSIQLVNLSIVTNTCVKPSSAVIKGPIMFRPQHANGHEGGIGDEIMRWNIGLFAKELTVGAPANECFGICQRNRPVETRTKRLAD